MLFDVQQLRADFPMLAQTIHGEPLIYLDTAATALTPQPVIDAITRYYTQEYATVHRAAYSLAVRATEKCDESRGLVADLIGANREEIIFTKGTTESLNLLASSLGNLLLSPGDEVVISEAEHHSNIVPWQLACERYGAVLRTVGVDDTGTLLLEQLDALMSEKTKIVSIAHLSNLLGTIHPIQEIAKRAHTVGAVVVVDGAQAVPHLPVDVQELGADFYAFSGHKLYGPTGIGVLYGKREWLEKLPVYQGGGDMIERVTFEKTTYNSLPFRFEAGTPHIAGIIGLGAAIQYLQKWGLEAIAEHEKKLLEYATDQLKSLACVIGTAHEKGALISFGVPGVHPLDIATMLDVKGIAIRSGHQCAQPALDRFGLSSVCRVSFGCYTTFEEIETFIGRLSEVISKFARSA